MRIVPLQSIAIEGRHCEAGEPVEVAERTALDLIAWGSARRAPIAVEPAPEAPAPAPAPKKPKK